MAVSKNYPLEQVCQILLCELCYKQEDVNWFCKNCVKNICDNCKIVHMRIPSLQLHDIGSIGDGKICRETRQLCEKHGELIMYLCLTCTSKEICLKCAGSDHRQHKFLDIMQIAEETKRDIRDLLEEKSAYLSALIKVRNMIDQKREESGRNVREAKILISTRFNAIEKIKDDLMVVLNVHESRLNLQLSKEEGILEKMESKLRSEIESVRGNLDISIGSKVHRSVLDASKRLNEMDLPSLMQLPSPSVFSENIDISLTSKHLFGELNPQDSTKVDVLALAVRQRTHPSLYRHDLQIVSKFLHREPGSRYIVDVVTTQDGKAWITMKKNYLQLIDEEGKIHQCICLPTIAEHLALGPDNEVIVSYGLFHDAGKCVLKKIHKDYSHSDFMILSQYQHVYGLCLAKNLSVVCVVVDDEDNYFVVKQNQKGETKWKHPLGDLESYKLFVNKDKHGYFYFKIKSGLRFVKEKGKTVRQVGLGLDMKDVGPVETDKFDNFLVGTRDGRILIYDKDFQVQRIFYLPEEKRDIFSLAIAEEDKLWISTRSGYVYITKYLD